MMLNPNPKSDFKKIRILTTEFRCFSDFLIRLYKKYEKLFSGVKKYAESESEVKFPKKPNLKNRFRILVKFDSKFSYKYTFMVKISSRFRISTQISKKTKVGVLSFFLKKIYIFSRFVDVKINSIEFDNIKYTKHFYYTLCAHTIDSLIFTDLELEF